MRGAALGLLSALVLGSGCAHQAKPPVPTARMAEASMAVHRAHQGTCRRDPEGLALYGQAERALDASRKRVRAGDHEQAGLLADEALQYALRAIAIQSDPAELHAEHLDASHGQVEFVDVSDSAGGESANELGSMGAQHSLLAP